MKRVLKIISVFFACLAVLCVVAAAAIKVRQLLSDHASEKTFGELRDSAEAAGKTPMPTPADTASPPPETTSGPTASPEPAETPEPTPAPTTNPYRDSFLANSDMAAWLKIPGTNIDYPLMWTPREEEYYLRRGFDGRSDDNGCLILDTDSCLDPLTTNLIVHGHNMSSGLMFGKLADYEDPDFCDEHRFITLYTKELQRNYEVIAVFRSQVFRKSDQTFKFYKFFQADTPEEFDDFYENIKSMAFYDTGVTAEFGDHFLTLSTCSYHVTNGRFVVVAKEIESGDTYLQ